MADHRMPLPPEPSAALHAWRAAHPDATFTEIEQAVDAQLRAVRAELLTDLAGTEEIGDAGRCPACGQTLVQRGTRARTLATQGDQSVTLTRSYATCPACGVGLFPPR